jgi:hypothetical protein
VLLCFAMFGLQCLRFLLTGVSMFKGAEAQQDGI